MVDIDRFRYLFATPVVFATPTAKRKRIRVICKSIRIVLEDDIQQNNDHERHIAKLQSIL